MLGVVEPPQLIVVERQRHSQPVERDLAGAGIGPAERVLGVVVGVHRLDVRDDGRAERRLAGAHRLQRDVVAGEHRGRRRAARSRRRCSRRSSARARRSSTCRRRARRGPASIALTWPIRTTSSMRRSCSSSACDTIAQRYIVGSTDSSMRSRQPSASSRTKRSSTDVGLRDRPRLRGEVGAARGVANCMPGLDGGAVEQPGVARLDPGQPVRRDAVAQQPQAGVHGRLARADDRRTGRGAAGFGQLVGRDAVDAGATS